jgi:hypothetical protein
MQKNWRIQESKSDYGSHRGVIDMGKEVYLSDDALDILCQYDANMNNLGINEAILNMYKHINELKNKEEMARFEASYARNKDLMNRLAKK